MRGTFQCASITDEVFATNWWKDFIALFNKGVAIKMYENIFDAF